jgi:hypothetical protein
MIKLFEEFNKKKEIDPSDASKWKVGDTIICTNKGRGKRLEIGKEYKIFDITKPSGQAVMIKGDYTYYSTKYFIKKFKDKIKEEDIEWF